MSKKKVESQRNEASGEIARLIMEAYAPKTAEDMSAALREVFAPMFEAVLQGEMDAHLGYGPNERAPEGTTDRRNGYSQKTVKTTMGPVTVSMPRDREATFESAVSPKNSTDASGIEGKVISMYARGMSQRDIAETVREMYGFDISAETVSTITDRVLDEMREWRARPLRPFYPFVFVDCLYASVRADGRASQHAVYVALGYGPDGGKDVLGLWMGDSEGAHFWAGVLDEIRARGVEDVLFVCMDGLCGLEDAVEAAFPKAICQRCIVHMIRNSTRHVPDKEMGAFCSDLRQVYGAVSLDAARSALERLEERWARYPGAVGVWKRNFRHVEQLFDYGPYTRRAMYTTNAIESVNSSLRKVTKKGTFQSEAALLKPLYLRVRELERKWEKGVVSCWKQVRNELMLDPSIAERFERYDKG